MKAKRMLMAAVSAFVACGSLAADAASEQSAVRHVLMFQFDRPDARLQVDPVVVVGDAAVAGWVQGERGGRALLLRKAAQWRIVLCAGDALRDAKVLREAGVAPPAAERLAAALAASETRLPAAYRAKLALFGGIVRMDAEGAHPPGHRQ